MWLYTCTISHYVHILNTKSIKEYLVYFGSIYLGQMVSKNHLYLHTREYVGKSSHLQIYVAFFKLQMFSFFFFFLINQNRKKTNTGNLAD